MDIYDMCKVIYNYERANKIQEKDCLTYWFGDYNMVAPKINISDEQIKKRYSEIIGK